jgi:transglutaminase-like putative cysteine protease
MTATINDADFLASTAVIDWRHPDVHALALRLAGGESDRVLVARRCFEWVRDEIEHSLDFRRAEVTCKASDVLVHRTGFCYAKSHLLAALLRANNIPAGFCYQRLSVDGAGPPYSLHGFNAALLPESGWYRMDARSNKAGVAAEFEPPVERLAFAIQFPGEVDFPGVWSAPLPVVVDTLTRFDRAQDVAANLPDLNDPMDGQNFVAIG